MTHWLLHIFSFFSIILILLTYHWRQKMLSYIIIQKIKWGNSYKHIRTCSFLIFCTRHCTKHFTCYLKITSCIPILKRRKPAITEVIFDHMWSLDHKQKVLEFNFLWNSEAHILPGSKQDWLALLFPTGSPHTTPFYQPFREGAVGIRQRFLLRRLVFCLVCKGDWLDDL